LATLSTHPSPQRRISTSGNGLGHATGSLGGTSSPVSPWRTISTTRTSVATIAPPQAAASARPSGGLRDTTAARRRAPGRRPGMSWCPTPWPPHLCHAWRSPLKPWRVCVSTIPPVHTRSPVA
jgi:hypothetical protein